MPPVRAFRKRVRLTTATSLLRASWEWERRRWKRIWKPIWELITIRRVTAGGILFAAGSFGVASLEYWHKGQEERLERALSLIEKVNTEPDAPEEEAAKWKALQARRALVVHFPDRFKGKPLPEERLPRSVAVSLLETSRKPHLDSSDRELFEKWDTARRHLNRLEIFAFAYVYDFADRKLLAASACGAMVRSNAYFGALIDVFRDEFGYAQSWQIIPQAVEMMQREYGEGCEKLYSAAAKGKSTPVAKR